MYVAVLGERGEDLQPGGRDPGGAEDGQPLGQRAELGVRSELGAGVVEQLGRAGRAEVGAKRAARARPARAGRRAAGSRRLARPGPRPRLGASAVGTVRTRRTSARAGWRRPAGGPCRRRHRRGAGSASRARAVGVGLDDLEQRPGQGRGSPPLDARGVLRRDSLSGARRASGSAREQRRSRTPRHRRPRRAHAPAAEPTTARRPWRGRRRPQKRTDPRLQRSGGGIATEQAAGPCSTHGSSTSSGLSRQHVAEPIAEQFPSGRPSRHRRQT